MTDTILLSDIHAGLDTSRWEAIPAEIDKCNPRTVIMIGDVVDSAPIHSIQPCLDMLAIIARARRLIWVKGNHDWLLAEPLAKQMNIMCVEYYVWNDYNGANIAIHGHQFDSMITEHPTLSEFATNFYAEMQQLTGVVFAEWAKHVSKVLAHDNERVAAGALAYAKECKVNNIFCGHTHEFVYKWEDKINYYNDGTCASTNGTYLTINKHGLVELQTF